MMDFFQAGIYIKQAEGNKVRRDGWAGKALEYIEWDFSENVILGYEPNKVIWTPSEQDILAVDYEIHTV